MGRALCLLGRSNLFCAVADAVFPEGSEEVGDVVDGGGRVDLPVGRQGGLSIGNVEEVIYPR